MDGGKGGECVAVCYSVLQCVSVCCSVLQCVAVCCSVLQCVVVCCSVLRCEAVRFGPHSVMDGGKGGTQRNPPPGGVSYLLCSLIKNRV